MKTASNDRDASALKRRAVPWASAALAVGVVAFLALRSPVATMRPVSQVTIAVPTQISSALMHVAFGQGLFKQAGVDVINQPFELGKDALKSLLNGKADLAVVADTPVMFALIGGADIAMLAGISQVRSDLAVVVQGDVGITQIQDLRGKLVGVTMGTNMPYFLDAMLQARGVPSDKVNLTDLKTDELISAFKAGQIDAAVMFQPFRARLEAEMGDRIKVFRGEDVYAARFMLVGKPSYIDSHPQEVRRVLKALIAANQAIIADLVEARRAVGRVVKIDDATMAKLFEPEDYAVSLDQSMLLALDDQTRWAMQKGLVPSGAVPNYLNALKYQPLEAVLPTAVTVVR